MSSTTIVQKVWGGSLPLEITLAAASASPTTGQPILPYYIQYPRMGYTCFLLPRLHRFFAGQLSNEASLTQAWLECEDVALKWHYPLGLLHDLFSPGSETDTKDSTQPWRLTVHFTNFPTDTLLPYDGSEKRIREIFFNALKEADYVRTGSAKAVNKMSVADSDRLWKAVVACDLEGFRKADEKLVTMALQHAEISRVPVRFLVKATSVRVVQASVKVGVTLGEAANGLMPELFPSRRNVLLAKPILHGVVVPLQAPVGELAAFACPDGFVCIVVDLVG
ncbi:APG5-domain-containing protein [Piedraia hortae CBS 480.64]|uniref:Autophagy protein 5 n=1 Tax=Piedraia hortae CBS 480.64 TaxID=1314780 RepID=A0A6A7C7X0_9PEZI|nr:APG5-domain-containing protein [Piedraia hortae CBS 480.64]